MIHKHHRKLRRSKDERPVNLIGLPDVIHQWVHDNPEKAREAGLIVSQHDDPAEIMVTIPEEALKAATKARPRLKDEARKTRKTISLRVPNTAEENGAEVYDTLIDAAREKLAPEHGWSDTVEPYFVITAALAAAIQ